MKTADNTLYKPRFQREIIKGNSFRKSKLQKSPSRLNRLFKQYQKFIASISATLLTSTLLLGGSYLFFVNLAEYGW